MHDGLSIVKGVNLMLKKNEGIDIVKELGRIHTIEEAQALYEQRLDAEHLSRIRKLNHSEILIKIANAIAIPAEEVVERLDEIPKDKEVFIHCSTGIRAEMAYVALKEKGYKAKFLDANIKVADSGSYEITEKE